MGETQHTLLAIETIVRLASGVHRMAIESFHFLSRHQDSVAHVLDRLGALDPDFIAHDPDAAACAGWIREHLPENRPAVLLHGDLLPRNILCNLDTDSVGVVDWEFAEIGDAAYDLAIVTRGNEKLFGVENGLRRLGGSIESCGN